MSTLELENIKHPDNSGNNITLAADGTIGGISITGLVGIGTTSPTRELDVQAVSGWAELALRGASGAGGSLEYYTNSTKRAEIYADTEDLVFRTGSSGAERMRIVSTGPVVTPAQPSFNVMNTNTLAISGGTTLVFNTARHNVGNHLVASTGIFTAPVAGRYLFTFKTLLYAMSTTEYLDFYPNVNNSARNRYEMTGNGGQHTQFTYSEVVQLSANDTFKLVMSDRSSGSYGMYGNENHFSGHLLG
jgi:hypothetical protein